MKKTISLFLTFMIIFTMVCAFTPQSVMAASRVRSIVEWNTFDSSKNYLKPNSNNFTYFQVSSADTSAKIEYFKDGIQGITTEPVLNVNSTKYIKNSGHNPLVNGKGTFSYDFYVPALNEGETEVNRQHYFSISDVNGSANFGITLNMKSSKGNVHAYTDNTNWTSKTNSGATNTFPMTYGEWHTVAVEMDITNGVFTMNIYYDDILMWTGTRTLTPGTDNTPGSVKINQIYFNNMHKDTYMKNIKLTYNPCFTDVDFNSNVSLSGNKIYAKDNGFCNTDSGIKQLQSSSSASTAYYFGTDKVSHDWSNKDLKITLTPGTEKKETYAMVQNVRGILPAISADTTNYIELSYDIKIDTGTESTERKQSWSGNND